MPMRSVCWFINKSLVGEPFTINNVWIIIKSDLHCIHNCLRIAHLSNWLIPNIPIISLYKHWGDPISSIIQWGILAWNYQVNRYLWSLPACQYVHVHSPTFVCFNIEKNTRVLMFVVRVIDLIQKSGNLKSK